MRNITGREYIYGIAQYKNGATYLVSMGEIVRCKDCKCSDVYQSDSMGATAMYCRAFTFHRIVSEGDYCSYGERREDE